MWQDNKTGKLYLAHIKQEKIEIDGSDWDVKNNKSYLTKVEIPAEFIQALKFLNKP